MASIEKRGKNSWRLVVEVGFDANGKRKKKYKTIRVEDPSLLRAPKRLSEHLNDELTIFKREVEAGEYIAPEKMTFAAFVEEWRVKYAEKELSRKTVKEYVGDLNRRFIPVFGHKQITEIKTMHIVTLFNEFKSDEGRIEKKKKKPLQDIDQVDKKKKPLSGSRILFLYKVLKCVFDRAVEWRVLSKSPMEGIKQPKIEKVERKFFDEEEATRIIFALMDEPEVWRHYFTGALMGGFRRGELLGLEWSEVDFENCTLKIDKQLSLTENGKAILDKPKTASSKETIDMPAWYMRDLKEYYDKWQADKEEAGDAWEGGDHQFVFHSGLGKPYFYTTPSATWRKFLKRRGFRHVRLHDLRHSTGTLLLESGEDLKSIQHRLRHSKQETTSDIYLHVTKKMKKRTANKLEKFDPKAIRPQSVPNNENGATQLLQ